MKKTVNIGVYGWCDKSWLNSFYPDDLPISAEEDWRLAYYSNEYRTVLVPADYWYSADKDEQEVNAETWLDDVDEDFKFFVECSAALLKRISLDEFAALLQTLRKQVAGIVVLDAEEMLSEVLQTQLYDLAQSLSIKVYSNTVRADGHIWSPLYPKVSDLAVIEDNSTDLRSLRTKVDQFMSDIAKAGLADTEATIILKHPDLQAHDLSQCRQMLEIMGY